ncbi:MAG TPA: phosphatidylglycerophosphatase A [Candidatus Acidoferrales bacterium]|jgi:phosphatidylglycerophosphatase A|nr:phosphatidylglycerophosphatase A [Candidatus Acidoferrales bacterium]
MTSEPAPSTASAGKPRISYLIATALGLGYLKPGPGTWGSLGGVALTLAIAAPFTDGLAPVFAPIYRRLPFPASSGYTLMFYLEIIVALLVSLGGVFAATKVARFSKSEDPQIVVIDEVSGVMITFLVGLGVTFLPLHDIRSPDFVGFGYIFLTRILNWKCLLLGFILFRVFDIWKPFPARQAEKLSGGWGIMADDWIAGIYAALGLWAARALGLLA